MTEYLFPKFTYKLKQWLTARYEKIWGEKHRSGKLSVLLKQAAASGAEAGLIAGQQAMLEAAYRQAFDEAQRKIRAYYQPAAEKSSAEKKAEKTESSSAE